MDLKLDKLPNRIRDKAQKVINSMLEKPDYKSFFGKRIKKNRNLVSISLNKQYRIVFIYNNCSLKPILVSTHNKYDHFMKNFQENDYA